MRLLFFSCTYPAPAEPGRGAFNQVLVAQLRQTQTVQVVSPVPWTSALRASDAPPPPGESFPTFFYPPGFLHTWQHVFLWASAKGALRRVLREFGPEAVISYWAHPDGAVALRAAREARIPCVLIVGGSDVLLMTSRPRRRREILSVLEGVDVVLTLGEHLRRRVVALGIPALKVRVLRRWVDSKRFHPGPRDEARHRLGLPFDRKIVLWVGRMVAVKGLDVLLSAWGRLQRGGRSDMLWLVGSGPLQPALQGQAAAEGLSGTVRFAGPVPHEALGDWYRAADLTVLPSRSEGIPNVLLESSACGTPFVASRVGGVPEIADDPAHELVPAGDAAALAAALARRLAVPKPTLERRGVADPVATILAAIEQARRPEVSLQSR